MLTHRRLATTVMMLLPLVGTSAASGKAAFADKNEMIARATVIAVVTIDKVEPAEVKGQHWTYRQRAFARVETALKSGPPAEFVLHGDEDFICAQCRFTPGKHLVFLVQDHGLWVGCNWHLSVRPVTRDADGNEMVDWLKPGNAIETAPSRLAEVLGEIRARLDAKPAD